METFDRVVEGKWRERGVRWHERASYHNHSLAMEVVRMERRRNWKCDFVGQWRLLRGGQLIIMVGKELVEWHQTHGTHLFGIVPLIMLQPLPRVYPLQLRLHQPPVLWVWMKGRKWMKDSGLGECVCVSVCALCYMFLDVWMCVHVISCSLAGGNFPYTEEGEGSVSTGASV